VWSCRKKEGEGEAITGPPDFHLVVIPDELEEERRSGCEWEEDDRLFYFVLCLGTVMLMLKTGQVLCVLSSTILWS
jgi:hypothetical protein